jgi:pro-apoptotic serine protease NMA111
MREASLNENNMLVAKMVLPEGPADHEVREGDVLLKVNSELLTSFVKLDAILDSSVGARVRLLMQRSGEDKEVTLNVQDLRAITPDRFVTVTGASFHNLSYQQARLYGIACRGLYVCEGDGSFNLGKSRSGWIIDMVDHRSTPDLDSFIEVMKTIRDKCRVVVSYRHVRDLHTRENGVVYIDRHWHPGMNLAIRNDETGLWNNIVNLSLGIAVPKEGLPETHARMRWY